MDRGDGPDAAGAPGASCSKLEESEGDNPFDEIDDDTEHELTDLEIEARSLEKDCTAAPVTSELDHPLLAPDPSSTTPIAAASSSSTSTSTTAAPAHVESQEERASHRHMWLTRTCRAATCAACKAQIPGWSPRVLYHPNPGRVKDLRRWRDTFWRYFHCEKGCIIASPAQEFMLRDLVVDVARKRTENADDVALLIRQSQDILAQALLAKAGGAVAEVGSAGGAASSTTVA